LLGQAFSLGIEEHRIVTAPHIRHTGAEHAGRFLRARRFRGCRRWAAAVSPGPRALRSSVRLAQGTDCVIDLARCRSRRRRDHRARRARQEWRCA
jgi:hypothetical protein